jgi:hypothetical protein
MKHVNWIELAETAHRKLEFVATVIFVLFPWKQGIEEFLQKPSLSIFRVFRLSLVLVN